MFYRSAFDFIVVSLLAFCIMYFLFFVTTCIFSRGSATDIRLWTATKLSAVTYFDGIEKFYHDLRQEQRAETSPTEPAEIVDKTLVKKKICEQILTSHFFEMKLIDWVDVEQRNIREELLRDDKKEILSSIFDKCEDKNRPCSCNQNISNDYRNGCKLRQVRARENVDGNEFGFVCIGRDKISGSLKEYFISQPYNVNSNASADPIAGRFIFSFNDDSGSLGLIALAEHASLQSDFERILGVSSNLYEMGRRLEIRPAPSPDLDPVCSLPVTHKLRLCAIVLGSSTLKKKFKFLPILDSVQEKCVKKSLKLMFLGYFEEWVMGCKTLNRKNGRQKIFYVSTGTFRNSVILFVEAGQRISLYNICLHVSVAYTVLPRIDSADVGLPDDMRNTRGTIKEPIATSVAVDGHYLLDDVED